MTLNSLHSSGDGFIHINIGSSIAKPKPIRNIRNGIVPFSYSRYNAIVIIIRIAPLMKNLERFDNIIIRNRYIYINYSTKTNTKRSTTHD